MTDTTAQHIAARADKDLEARLVASAEQAGIPQAETFVQLNMGILVATRLNEAGDTITATHAYASGVRQSALDALPPLPGINPAAVTDEQLASAVSIVWEAPPKGSDPVV